MFRKRKSFSNEFKAKVAMESIKGFKTITELSQEYEVHPNQIGQWKKYFIVNSPDIFSGARGPRTEKNIELIDKLYQQIGKLQVELDWLKKKYESLS